MSSSDHRERALRPAVLASSKNEADTSVESHGENQHVEVKTEIDDAHQETDRNNNQRVVIDLTSDTDSDAAASPRPLPQLGAALPANGATTAGQAANTNPEVEQYELAYHSADHARNDDLITMAPTDDDVTEVRKNMKDWVLKLRDACLSDEKGLWTPKRMSQVDFETWLDKHQRRIVEVDNEQPTHIERFSWIVVDDVCILHERGVPNIYRSKKESRTDQRMKCSDRLRLILEIVSEYSIVALDIVLGQKLDCIVCDPLECMLTKIQNKSNNNNKDEKALPVGEQQVAAAWWKNERLERKKRVAGNESKADQEFVAIAKPSFAYFADPPSTGAPLGFYTAQAGALMRHNGRQSNNMGRLEGATPVNEEGNSADTEVTQTSGRNGQSRAVTSADVGLGSRSRPPPQGGPDPQYADPSRPYGAAGPFVTDQASQDGSAHRGISNVHPPSSNTLGGLPTQPYGPLTNLTHPYNPPTSAPSGPTTAIARPNAILYYNAPAHQLPSNGGFTANTAYLGGVPNDGRAEFQAYGNDRNAGNIAQAGSQSQSLQVPATTRLIGHFHEQPNAATGQMTPNGQADLQRARMFARMKVQEEQATKKHPWSEEDIFERERHIVQQCMQKRHQQVSRQASQQPQIQQQPCSTPQHEATIGAVYPQAPKLPTGTGYLVPRHSGPAANGFGALVDGLHMQDDRLAPMSPSRHHRPSDRFRSVAANTGFPLTATLVNGPFVPQYEAPVLGEDEGFNIPMNEGNVMPQDLGRPREALSNLTAHTEQDLTAAQIKREEEQEIRSASTKGDGSKPKRKPNSPASPRQETPTRKMWKQD